MNLFYSHAENSIIFNSGVDYEKNWFTFGSLRYCKDEPGLKIFFSLYDENICMVQKRTESGLETECFILDFFNSAPVWSQTVDYVRFPVRSWLFYRFISQSAITCSKLTIKTVEQRPWRRSGIFIVNFEHISYLVLVFLLLTLSR